MFTSEEIQVVHFEIGQEGILSSLLCRPSQGMFCQFCPLLTTLRLTTCVKLYVENHPCDAIVAFCNLQVPHGKCFESILFYRTHTSLQ